VKIRYYTQIPDSNIGDPRRKGIQRYNEGRPSLSQPELGKSKLPLLNLFCESG